MSEVQFAKQFLTTLDSKNTKYKSDHAFDPKTFQLRIPYTLPKLAHPPHPLPPKPTPTTTPAPGSEPVSQTPAQPATIDITLKSNRNPTFTLRLPNLPTTTPITTLKSQIQTLLSGSVQAEKIKILHNKKPIPASKSTVYDVLLLPSTDDTTTPTPIDNAEFGVMILGGAADPSPPTQTVTLNNETTTTSAPGPGSENAAVEAVLGVNPGDHVMKDVPAVDLDSVDEKLQREKSPSAAAAVVQPGASSGKEVLGTSEFWDDLQGFLEQRLRDTEEARRLRGVFEKVVLQE